MLPENLKSAKQRWEEGRKKIMYVVCKKGDERMRRKGGKRPKKHENTDSKFFNWLRTIDYKR